MFNNKKINKHLTSVKGMNDLFLKEATYWEKFEQIVYSIVKSYCYQQIRTPIIEYTSLFLHNIGEMTDIVKKEMYSFVDRLNGEELTLRPENTVAIVRAAIEHNLLYDGPKRLWYIGPMFRHERPQRGRYRQFYQVGIEALGFTGPDIDFEIIMMCQRLWNKLGIKNIKLEINSLGQIHERERYRNALVLYLEKYINMFDDINKQRLYRNPLRILDTKSPILLDIINSAPQLIDFLEDKSLSHLESIKQKLLQNGITFSINPKLVRGLDYYNLTVFEWISIEHEIKSTIAGGGRYDQLFEKLGGKPTPSCGWAIGIERVIELFKRTSPKLETNCDIYIVHQGDLAKNKALLVSEQLRNVGLKLIVHSNNNIDGLTENLSSQMKFANKSGAMFAIIIGNNEIMQNTVIVKPLHSVNNVKQYNISFDLLVEHLVKIFGYL